MNECKKAIQGVSRRWVIFSGIFSSPDTRLSPGKSGILHALVPSPSRYNVVDTISPCESCCTTYACTSKYVYLFLNILPYVLSESGVNIEYFRAGVLGVRCFRDCMRDTTDKDIGSASGNRWASSRRATKSHDRKELCLCSCALLHNREMAPPAYPSGWSRFLGCRHLCMPRMLGTTAASFF